MSLMKLVIILFAISDGCMSQNVTTNEVPSTVSVTTRQIRSTVTAPPSPKLCVSLASVSKDFCQLSGRNSVFTYPQSFPGVDYELDFAFVESLAFAIQSAEPPLECIDGVMRTFCVLLAPPCDPVSDLRLPICEQSCKAITRLKLEGTCTELDSVIINLDQSSDTKRFRFLKDFYFAFDCRNSSTYDFYNGTLNFTKNGQCTSVISPGREDLILSRPPVCKPVPMGHCSQSNPTGYYFETSQLSHNENTVMELLNSTEISITDVEFCQNKDLLTDLVCLFVYPSCIPENRTQVVICEESCTNLNTFISECIPFNGGQNDTENSTIADAFFSKITNLICSDNPRSYLIPGAQVSKNQCIQLGNGSTLDLNTKMEKSNRSLVIIIVLCLVPALATVAIGVSLMIIFVCLRQRKHILKMDAKNSLVKRPTKVSFGGYEQADKDMSSETPDNICLTKTDMEEYQALFSSVLVPYERLNVGEGIGEGAFGKVFKGQRLGTDLEKPRYVAIKTIKNLTSQEELKAFFSESLIMKDFNHPNVLGLAGVCFDTPDSYPFLILPFMVNGSLKDYLKKSRRHITDIDSLPEGVPLSGLVQMCLDIVRGMKYLAEKKFVHRDLAARNCMVDSRLRIKVGDFGLARDVYSSDYYRANRNTKIPVKWMPPETLHDGISNEKTDVWSYGVTCWEAFSLGRTPYPGINNHDVLNFISTGGRLEKPSLCPVDIYSIIKLCWELKPEDRPNFNDISDLMEEYWDREHLYI